MEPLSLIQKLTVWVLPVVFAITVHEVAHGWMALRLGDRTAMMLGRLTLNPVRHIDPIGTLLIPGLMLMFGGVIFGWAKPVPVTWENLRHPKRDMVLVACAGPAANLLMAIFWLLIAKLALVMPESASWFSPLLVYMGVAGMMINCVLMVLNLFPLPPLDGGRVVAGLLPGPWAWKYSRIEPYGLPIILLLLITGVLGQIIWPVIETVLRVLFYAGQLPPSIFQAVLGGIA